MVTDTAFYRYPHYHMPEDTPDQITHDALARVTAGLCRVAARRATVVTISTCGGRAGSDRAASASALYSFRVMGRSSGG
jgi:hypothetical protein